jgi:hypothetical protein
MPSPSDFRRASRLARSVATGARKAGELAAASGEVIARRAAMGASAMGDPSAAAAEEAMTMVSEKGFAMARSGLAAARAVGDLSNRAATIALDETRILTGAVAAAARCRTPMELAMVQGDYAYRAFGRMLSQGLGWAGLAAAAGGAAMAPFHTAATANARRLRK